MQDEYNLARFTKDELIVGILSVLNEKEINKIIESCLNFHKTKNQPKIQSLKDTIKEMTSIVNQLDKEKSKIFCDIFEKCGGNEEMTTKLLAAKSIEVFKSYDNIVSRMRAANKTIATCRRAIENLDKQE